VRPEFTVLRRDDRVDHALGQEFEWNIVVSGAALCEHTTVARENTYRLPRHLASQRERIGNHDAVRHEHPRQRQTGERDGREGQENKQPRTRTQAAQVVPGGPFSRPLAERLCGSPEERSPRATGLRRDTLRAASPTPPLRLTLGHRSDTHSRLHAGAKRGRADRTPNTGILRRGALSAG